MTVKYVPIWLCPNHSRRRRHPLPPEDNRHCLLSNSHSPPNPSTANSDTANVFGGKKELSGFQSLVDSMSPPVRLASSVIVFASAVAAGYGLGFKFGGSRNAGLGSAVAVGAAGAGAAYALNSSVPEVAAVD